MSSGVLLTRPQSLEDRVAALEQALAELEAPDTLEPNVITVSPSGQIGANFTGNVDALGLQLPVAPTYANPFSVDPTKVIQFLRVDGTSAGQIAVKADTFTPGDDGQAALYLTAATNGTADGNGPPQIRARALKSSGAGGSVGPDAKLCDADGDTDFATIWQHGSVLAGPTGGAAVEYISAVLPAGLFLAWFRATGTNISEQYAYLIWQSERTIQSAFQTLGHTIYNGQAASYAAAFFPTSNSFAVGASAAAEPFTGGGSNQWGWGLVAGAPQQTIFYSFTQLGGFSVGQVSPVI